MAEETDLGMKKQNKNQLWFKSPLALVPETIELVWLFFFFFLASVPSLREGR